MQEIYFIVLTIVLVMTLPFASRKLAYSYNPLQHEHYDALAGLSKNTRRASYILFAIITFILVMVCVNKPENMSDVSMYMNIYESGGQENSHKSMEPTYAWISKISPTFTILLLYYAILSVGTHVLGIIKNSSNIWLSMFTYMIVFYVLHDVIQIRAAVAAGIILISIRFISERRWILYFALIGIASLFHYSALSFLPLYFLPKKRLVKWVWIGFIGIAVILALFNIQIGSLSRYIPLKVVEMYVNTYLGNREHVITDTLNLEMLIRCAVLAVLVFKSDKITKVYPYAPICIALSIMSQVVYLLMGDIPVLRVRMGELFGVADIFTNALIPLLSKKNYYILFIIAIILILFRLNTTLILLEGV